MTFILGITGRARSGKNTVASYIADQLLPGDVTVRGFADAVKVSAARALGYQGENPLAWGDELKHATTITVTTYGEGPGGTSIVYEERQLSGREYLQWYGTEAHRDLFGADFWTRRALDEPFEGRVLVLPDLRFDDEARAVRALGGEVWRVERPGEPIADSGHSSEAGVSDDLVTRVIPNAGGFADLYRATTIAFSLAWANVQARGQA